MRIAAGWRRYIVDHRYYGVAALVESYAEFLRTKVWRNFNAIFFSTYNKFLAALEGKIDINSNPEIVKYIATTGTEGRLKPSINFDITSVEPDENVTPLFYNFSNLSASFERIIGIEDSIIINGRYLLIPQYMYVKVNLDCNAVFGSWYEKVDFEISLLQEHAGLNRVFTPYKMEVVVPLNGYLEEDLNLDPEQQINVTYVNRNAAKRKLNEIVYRFIHPTGRQSFHITYYSAPKITLTSLNDASEKYGSDRLPDFRTNFSVTLEDNIISSYIVINLATLEGITAIIGDWMNIDPVYNRTLSFLEEFFSLLFQYLNLPFSYETFVEILNFLMEFYNFQSIEEMLEYINRILCSQELNDIEVLLSAIATFIQNQYNITVPEGILYSFLVHLMGDIKVCEAGFSSPLYFISPSINLTFLPLRGTCIGLQTETLRFLVYEVSSFVPKDSELRIPSSFWKLTPNTRFITVINAYGQYYLDHSTQEIVINGPILKGFKFVIVVQIQ